MIKQAVIAGPLLNEEDWIAVMVQANAKTTVTGNYLVTSVRLSEHRLCKLANEKAAPWF